MNISYDLFKSRALGQVISCHYMGWNESDARLILALPDYDADAGYSIEFNPIGHIGFSLVDSNGERKYSYISDDDNVIGSSVQSMIQSLQSKLSVDVLVLVEPDASCIAEDMLNVLAKTDALSAQTVLSYEEIVSRSNGDFSLEGNLLVEKAKVIGKYELFADLEGVSLLTPLGSGSDHIEYDELIKGVVPSYFNGIRNVEISNFKILK